jgi:ClpP class serine protease
VVDRATDGATCAVAILEAGAPLPRTPASYRLTPALVADHVGASVMCLAPQGLGRTYPLHARRPGPELNRRALRTAAGIEWHAELPPVPTRITAPEPARPPLVRVEIRGALDQRAAPRGECSAWTDGHDAVTQRLCGAFAEGDVLLVVDSPGGVLLGLREGIATALKAKAEHGRRVTVVPAYQIGSAAFWWAAALADELFVTVGSQVGSIGVRGQINIVAGKLAKEGVEVEHFVWPNDGKIAMTPDRPLSAEGRARGDREVAQAGEAFCAAVCGSPVGQRYGLTRDRIVQLGADMLTGQDAVEAGLADGVATEDEVVAYALQLASEGASTRAAQVRAKAQAPGRAA